jgi:hypothetical protein
MRVVAAAESRISLVSQVSHGEILIESYIPHEHAVHAFRQSAKLGLFWNAA